MGHPTARLVRATITTGEWIPELVTVPNIELVEVGEDWETSTGVFTWEPEDLLSAISSQEDPAVRTPVVKLGHEDPRWNGPKDVPLDGQPAFGRIANLRITNNGQTLVGDLVGVPAWLATIMPTAYPRRSIEGYFQQKTRTGNTWPFLLTAVALLGTAYPAINTLEDLKILWGATPPPLVEVDDVQEVAATAGGLIRARRLTPVAKVKSGNVLGAGVKATTSTSDIQREWYDSLENNQMWWWIRQVLVNPLQLVVDDDDGGLYLVDVTVASDDTITYGEPQPVKVEYVAATASGLVEVHKDGQIVAASYEDAAASGGKVKAADRGDADDEEEESDMPKLSDDAIRRLGLEPGKATDDEINAAIMAKIAAEAEDADADDDDADDTETDDADDDADDTDDAPDTTTPAAPVTTPTTPTTAPPTVPDGMTLVDSAQWEEMKTGVAAATGLVKKQKAKERDDFIAAACKKGKFPRARVGHYTTLWNSDPQGTKVLIENLAEGLIPIDAKGVEGEVDPAVAAAAYPDSWKQDRRVAAQRNSVSTRVKVVND
jgi:hypothetical protein